MAVVKSMLKYIDTLCETTTDFTIVDIGGGTGDTISKIKQGYSWACRVHCTLVEPHAKLAEQAIDMTYPPDTVICMSAEKYVMQACPASVDVIICQQMIHHIDGLDSFLTHAKRLLKPGGLIIIVTRSRATAFPFGMHGKRSWSESIPVGNSPEEISPLLTECGFRTSAVTLRFPMKVDVSQWVECISTLPMFSNISSLSETDRSDDVKEIRGRYQNEDHIIFNDEQWMLLGLNL